MGGFRDLMADCVCLLVLISRNYEIYVFHDFCVLNLAFKDTIFKCYSDSCRHFSNSLGSIP